MKVCLLFFVFVCLLRDIFPPQIPAVFLTQTCNSIYDFVFCALEMWTTVGYKTPTGFELFPVQKQVQVPSTSSVFCSSEEGRLTCRNIASSLSVHQLPVDMEGMCVLCACVSLLCSTLSQWGGVVILAGLHLN